MHEDEDTPSPYGTYHLDKSVSALAEKRPVRAVSFDDLSRDQRAVVKAIRAWQKGGEGGCVTFGGYAGTGKTTVLGYLASIFAREGLRVAYLAYTGKAANVLRAKLDAVGVPSENRYVGTIHSLLYKPVVNEKTGQVTGWEKVEGLETFDLLVTDESSMISEPIYRDLMGFGRPLLAVGDHGQLPPVEGAFNLMQSPVWRLETVHRQAEGSPILALAQFVRDHGALPRQAIDVPGCRIFLPGTGNLDDHLGSREDAAHLAVLAYRNDTRIQANQRIRARYDFPRQLSPGEWVICLRNTDFDGPKIFNGMRGLVRKVRDREPHRLTAEIAFPDEGVFIRTWPSRYQFGRLGFNTYDDATAAHPTFKPRTWPEIGMLFDHGYAITTHRSQGDQWRKVIVIAERPRPVSAEDYRRWLYTAVSRAEKDLVIFRDPSCPTV